MIKVVTIVKGIKLKSAYLAFVTAIISLFILTVHNQYLPPLMIAWTLFWLSDFVNRGGIAKDERRALMLLYMFLIFNVVVISGLFYSENIKLGSTLLFRRLSLLIFPVILFSPGEEIRKRVDVLLKVFVAGIISFLVICLFYAAWRSIIVTGGSWKFIPYGSEEPWLNYFFGQRLSLDQHPSYIAMYAMMGMFISLEFFTSHPISQGRKLIWLIAAAFLLISIYLLSSRASYLATLVILPFFLWIKLKPKKLGFLSVFSILVLLTIITVAVLKNQRISLYFDKSIDPSAIRDGRSEIWRSAIKVIEKHPFFGTGIGDYYNDMDKEFKSAGFTTGYYRDFNAHNEYLEILCSSGIIGFLLFMSMIGFMFIICFKDHNLLYGVFVMMILIFFGFESMLSRFAGNSFFALFSFLLIHCKGLKDKDKE